MLQYFVAVHKQSFAIANHVRAEHSKLATYDMSLHTWYIERVHFNTELQEPVVSVDTFLLEGSKLFPEVGVWESSNSDIIGWNCRSKGDFRSFHFHSMPHTKAQAFHQPL